MSPSWENRDFIFAVHVDITVLTYLTCMVKTASLLIFNKAMQSMFLAFYFSVNNT